LVLEPLDRDECDRLLDMLAAPADSDLRARILTAADGIPLFIEEMAAMLVAQSDRNEPTDEIVVPASIQALLAARLEQLPAPERTVLQRGSVEGQLFHHGFLRAALPQQSDVDGCVRTLVRKELLRADRPQLPGEQASSFRHILIRDSAYEALPKRTRADVHEHFGSWLSERAAGLTESDEIIAYHYEQAHLYRTELGLAESGGELATRAGELLATAARRASHRSDYRAASSLLRRAVKLLPPGPARVRALLHLGRLAETDQLTSTRLVLEQAEAEAKSLGLAALEIQAALELAHPLIDPNFSTHEQEALAARAIDVLGRHGDDEGLARAWFLVAMVRWSEAQSDRMQEPLERALEHARRAGQRGAEIGALRFLLTAKNLGSTPVDEGIEFARQTLREVGDSRELEAMVLRTEGWLLCLQGRLDEARERLEHARAIITDLGHTVFLAILAFSTGALEVRAGDLDAAEREYRNALESLQRLGERGRSTNLAAVLALVLLDQERPDEAEEYVTMSRELAAREDASGQAFWRIAAARLLAQRGETDDAIELADEAVSLLAPTEELLSRFELLLHQAEVLRFAGREADAAAAIEQAIELSERKRASGETRRARERLASLSSSRG